VREALAKGIWAGYPVRGVRVTLLEARMHEVDSDSMDFTIAASMAVREAFQAAGPALLEPVMSAEINLREEYLGGVLGYVNGRRGSVRSVETYEGLYTIQAEVPLANVRGCAVDLRDLTQGRCTFMLRFLRYDLVPDGVAEAIVAQRRAEGRVARR
jgi:elongation factor G